jgi:hypothetical protein
MAVLMLAVFAAALSGADTPMTLLRIEVKSYADRPVERASVVVKWLKGRSIVKLGKKVHTTWEVKTNQEGLAKIPSVPQGSILIQVIAKGYQTFGETYEVNEAERAIEIKLNAPQPQVSAHQ